MPETLPEFLKQRTVRACRSFQKEFHRLAAEEALCDVSPHWQPHKWGIGQNGSIAGIVYHVTAWIALTLPILQGNAPYSGTDLAQLETPPVDDWNLIREWYIATVQEWVQALIVLPDADFDRTLDWEGHTISVAQYLVDMYEHFTYHDGQVQYLKQKHLADAHGNP